MGLVGALIGGALLGGLMSRGGGGGEVVQQAATPAPTPAAQPAQVAESATQIDEKSKDDVYKKRRGKKGLLVNPLDKDKSASANSVGTGLNI